MQKPLTWILLVTALALFLFIKLFDRHIPATRELAEAPRLFPSLEPQAVSSVQFTFPSGEILRAERTNETWILRNPLYPAQQAAIENFLTNLVVVRKLDQIAGHEYTLQGAKSFGLEPPRATVEVVAGTNRYAFQVGGRAPLTNHIYLRLLPVGEVVLASVEGAALVPSSSDVWRDPRLVPLAGNSFDHLRIRVGTRSFELERNPTNRLWQITKPIPARADQGRIAGLLEVLRTASVGRFLGDAPPDLERFGLQTPQVELSLLQGTNRLYSLEFGGVVTNEPALVYARLVGPSNIVSARMEVADLLLQPYKNFHESQLVTLRPAALDRILIDAAEKFALQRQADGSWIAERAAQKLSVDTQLFGRFITNVMALEILDIAKEVPSDADLKALGFSNPNGSYSFFERLTNSAGIVTNILFTAIEFGTNQSDRIYVRRSDEAPVYLAPLGQWTTLFREMFQFRDRQIWNFAPSNIVRVTWSNAAGSASLQRNATGAWSDDTIANEAISEAVLRLSKLEAVEWTTKGEQRKPALGIRDNSLRLIIEVRGEKETEAQTVEFGTQTMQRNVYAAMKLPGETEPLIFQFPGLLFYSLLEVLPVPK